MRNTFVHNALLHKGLGKYCGLFCYSFPKVRFLAWKLQLKKNEDFLKKNKKRLDIYLTRLYNHQVKIVERDEVVKG